MCFVLISCFDPENGGITFLQNVGYFQRITQRYIPEDRIFTYVISCLILTNSRNTSTRKLSVSGRPNSYWQNLVPNPEVLGSIPDATRFS
jgi:hypothetical protein